MAVVEQDYPLGGSPFFQRASFTGNASEYFGIWIVNILLTIVTLGIYSAWAKVRRNRYFYGNTVILDHSFEYHAKGKQILIGRLIVFGVFLVLNVLSHIAPLAVLVIWPVLLVVFPWFLMRGLRFNARVTSYRNVRFDFVGTYGGAFKAIFLGALVTIVSFGLLSPIASRWFYKYIFDNLRYGDRPFSTEPRLGALYEALVTVIAIMIVSIVILGVVSAFAIGFSSNSMGPGMGSLSLWHWMIVLIFPIYLFAGLYYRATVRNIVWSAATVDHRHELRSDLGRRRYAWIAISNVVVTLVTLGLMRPWAAVRMQRFLAEHTAISIDGEIGVVFDQIRSTGNAISAEYLDVDGFDFGF
ncbi:YjgN family protein [Rhizobium sp. WW22]|uniref:YjgN family protein n=1 Tax=Rhizobium sp. WW22 TaxID=3389070 RepID=UPI000DD9FA9D